MHRAWLTLSLTALVLVVSMSLGSPTKASPADRFQAPERLVVFEFFSKEN